MMFKMRSHSWLDFPPRIKCSDCVWDLYEYVGDGITSSYAFNFIIVEFLFQGHNIYFIIDNIKV